MPGRRLIAGSCLSSLVPCPVAALVVCRRRSVALHGFLRFVQVLAIAPVFPIVVARDRAIGGRAGDRCHQLRTHRRRLPGARRGHHAAGMDGAPRALPRAPRLSRASPASPGARGRSVQGGAPADESARCPSPRRHSPRRALRRPARLPCATSRSTFATASSSRSSGRRARRQDRRPPRRRWVRSPLADGRVVVDGQGIGPLPPGGALGGLRVPGGRAVAPPHGA